MAGLAGAAGGVDKRCHVVVRGERQLPEICSTLTTVLNWKLPVHTYFDILKNGLQRFDKTIFGSKSFHVV